MSGELVPRFVVDPSAFTEVICAISQPQAEIIRGPGLEVEPNDREPFGKLPVKQKIVESRSQLAPCQIPHAPEYHQNGWFFSSCHNINAFIR